MALIKCKECGHLISDKAVKCPSCGCPVGAENTSQINKTYPMEGIPTTNPLYNGDSGKGPKWLYLVIALLAATSIGFGYAAWESGAFGGNSEDTDIQPDTIQAIQGQKETPTDSIEPTTKKEEKTIVPKANQPQKLKVAKVEFGYWLEPQVGNTYEPWKMCDGNPSTTWAVGLYNYNPYSDGFWGPIFSVRCKKLSHIIIRNGYCKNSNSYKNNARTTGVTFLNFENHAVLYDGALKDTSRPQRLNILPNSEGNNDIKQVGISFFNYDFIPGEKWNDLCISEVEFWGYK